MQGSWEKGLADVKILSGDYEVVESEEGFQAPEDVEYSHLRWQDGELRAVQIHAFESDALIALQAERRDFLEEGTKLLREILDEPAR